MLFQDRGVVKRIIDIGCGFGSISIELMKMLEKNRIQFQYTGVDPSKAQLKRFRELLQSEGRNDVRLVESRIEDFIYEEIYDLAYIGHSLYYAESMIDTLEKVIRNSKEVCIVHHGEGGINEVHQAFSEWVREGPHIISTYNQIISCLEQLKEQGMNFEYVLHEFKSLIDVKDCQNPASKRGRALIAFFLERDYETIPRRVRRDVRDFFGKQIGNSMLHDEAIILITSHPGRSGTRGFDGSVTNRK